MLCYRICCTCNAKFNSSADLIQHVSDVHTRTSDEGKSHSCDYCGQSYHDKLFLEFHIKIEHGHLLYGNAQLVWYACKMCSKLYTQSRYIRRHMRSVHSLYPSSDLAEEYQIKHLRDISFLCKDCSQPCLFTNTCQNHSMEHIAPSEDCQCPSHICQVCFAYFSNCSMLWTHMLGIHRKQRHFQCNICFSSNDKKIVRFPSQIVDHMRQKHGRLLSLEKISSKQGPPNKTRIYIEGVLKHRCSHCNEIFDVVEDIKRHFAQVHEKIVDRNMEKKYSCKFCGEQFSIKRLLRAHSRDVHNKLINFECDVCGRAFNYKSQLTRHLISHTRERASVCELCGAAFSQPAGLYNHKFTHEDTRYACSMCDRSYTHPALLKVHMKTHTDTTKYMCDTCGKEFNTVRNLKRHKLTHNTQKSFVCSICSTGFTVKKYLIQHYKTHYKE